MADLRVEVCGLRLKNPILPGGGPPCRDFRSIELGVEGGLGGILTKTVSAVAADVPLPNMAEVSKHTFLNTELWSELSVEHWVEHEYPRIRTLADEQNLPVIVGIGYTAEDLEKVCPLIAPYADAVEISTHYLSGDPTPMMETVRTAKRLLKVPVFMKLSPGGRDLIAGIHAAEEAGADGLTCINSFGPCFGIDTESGMPVLGSTQGYGWLSGPALKALALRCVFDAARETKLPILAVGGISTGMDMIEFFMVGASAVEICTAAIVKGPSIYGKVNAEANKWLDAHGYASINDIKGLTLRKMAEREKHSTYHLRDFWKPNLIEEACTGCGLCIVSCVYEAITQPGGHKALITIDDDACWRCGLCITRCPPLALTFAEVAGKAGA